MNPLRSQRSLESIEAEYMGGVAEKPSKKHKTADDVVRQYMGKAFEEEQQSVNPFLADSPGTSLIRGKDGRVSGFKDDEQFITLSEANKYLADQYAMLAEEIEDVRGSGLSDAGQKSALKKLESRESELKKLAKEVKAAEKSDASREARYEGSEYLIENPQYRPGTTYQEEMNRNLEDPEEEEITRVMKKPELEEADPMNLEGRRRGRDELYKIKDRLVRERDAIMWQLKYGGHTPEDMWKAVVNEMKQDPEYEDQMRKKNQRPVVRTQERGDLKRKSEAAHYFRSKAASLDDKLIEYPPTKEGEEKRRKIQEMSEIAEELEADLAPHAYKNVGEALRAVLDEIDEVQEEIVAAERNIKFSERRQAKKGSNRRAA